MFYKVRLLIFFMPSRVEAIIEAVVFPFSIVMNAKVFSFPPLGREMLPGFITIMPPSFSR